MYVGGLYMSCVTGSLGPRTPRANCHKASEAKLCLKLASERAAVTQIHGISHTGS